MKNIQWKLAVVTYNDRLHVFPSWDEPDFIMEFPPVTAVDDIGAGDAFDTGFLDWFINNAPKDSHSVYDGFRYAITVAQEKVQEVGVFLHA